MVRTKQGLSNNFQGESQEEVRGNSKILHALSPKKMTYPAQVIVRPFNLVSNPKAKEMVTSVQLNRPKERYKYQHNVNGDFDTSKVRDVILPSTSQTPHVLKSLVVSKCGTTSEILAKSDIQHSVIPTFVVNKKLDGSVERNVTAKEVGSQFEKIQVSSGKSVQDACLGSLTVTKRGLQFISAKNLVNINSPSFEVSKSVPFGGISSGSVQHKVVPLQSNCFPSPTVSRQCAVNNTSPPSRLPISVSKPSTEQGGAGNAVQVAANNKFQVVNTSVVNGQTFFVCKVIGDSQGTGAMTSITTTTATPASATTTALVTTTTTAAITTATGTPALSISRSAVSNSVPCNICQVSTGIITEDCGTSVVSAVKTPQMTASVCCHNVQKPNNSHEGLKTVHLEILEDTPIQLRKANNTKFSPENMPVMLPLNSPPVTTAPKQITEEQLRKLLTLKKSANEPLKLINITAVKDRSDIPQLVLQPIQKVLGKVPEVSAISIPQSNVELMNIANEKQQKTISATETLPAQLLLKNNAVQNPADARTAPGNLHVVLQQKVDAQMFQRRKEIALKYQQEVERMKNEKKVVTRVIMPQRTVDLVETATQTSLFSVIEPGRMVELSFTERMPAPNCKTSSSHEKDDGPQRVRSAGASLHSAPLAAASRSALLAEGEGAAAKRRKLDHAYLENRAEKSLSSVDRCERNAKRVALQNINNTVVIPAVSPVLATRQSNYDETEQLTPAVDSGICQNDTFRRESNSNKHGDAKKFRQIFMDWKACVESDDVGNIPLHYAVMEGNAQEVKRQCLVLQGRKEALDWGNMDDETPLHLAVARGSVEATKLLLFYKANPGERDAEGNTALHLAVGASSNLQCLEAVLEKVSKHSNLLDALNDDGYSPLHMCVINSKEKEVARLVAKGADVNTRDGKSGKTPLFHAVLAKNNLISRLLVRLGASTTVPNFSGQTPLSICEMSMFPSLDGASDDDLMDIDNTLLSSTPSEPQQISSSYSGTCMAQMSLFDR